MRPICDPALILKLKIKGCSVDIFAAVIHCKE